MLQLELEVGRCCPRKTATPCLAGTRGAFASVVGTGSECWWCLVGACRLSVGRRLTRQRCTCCCAQRPRRRVVEGVHVSGARGAHCRDALPQPRQDESRYPARASPPPRTCVRWPLASGVRRCHDDGEMMMMIVVMRDRPRSSCARAPTFSKSSQRRCRTSRSSRTTSSASRCRSFSASESSASNARVLRAQAFPANLKGWCARSVLSAASARRGPWP